MNFRYPLVVHPCLRRSCWLSGTIVLSNECQHAGTFGALCAAASVRGDGFGLYFKHKQNVNAIPRPDDWEQGNELVGSLLANPPVWPWWQPDL